MKFIQDIVKKPNWRMKLQNPEIREKWKAEAKDYEVREEVFEYAI